MNLKKATDEERLNVCRKYYLGGWFFLPWLWIINFFWFLPYATKSGADAKLRKMVVVSGVGAMVWVIIIAIWVSQYQQNRNSWSYGDSITANFPKGRE